MRNRAFIGLLLTASCSSSPKSDLFKPLPTEAAQAQRRLLVGRWYGEATEAPGVERRWLMDRRVDGTYTVKFKFKQAGQAIEQVEAGIWGTSGAFYFTSAREALIESKFTSLDKAIGHFDDAYRILELDANHFKYRSVEGYGDFTVRRVSEAFTL